MCWVPEKPVEDVLGPKSGSASTGLLARRRLIGRTDLSCTLAAESPPSVEREIGVQAKASARYWARHWCKTARRRASLVTEGTLFDGL